MEDLLGSQKVLGKELYRFQLFCFSETGSVSQKRVSGTNGDLAGRGGR